MHIGVAQRELPRANGERVLTPACGFVSRTAWLPSYSTTALPKGAHVRYKAADGLRGTTDDGESLVCVLDDPGPIKLPLSPTRCTISTLGVHGCGRHSNPER